MGIQPQHVVRNLIQPLRILRFRNPVFQIFGAARLIVMKKMMALRWARAASLKFRPRHNSEKLTWQPGSEHWIEPRRARSTSIFFFHNTLPRSTENLKVVVAKTQNP